MKRNRTSRALTLVLATIVPIVLLVALPGAVPASAADSTADPASTQKLIFIHHSSGENWLTDGNGNLGIALRDHKYFVSDTNYGWGPDSIGDNTNIGSWYSWFRGPSASTYLSSLYSESEQHCGYSRGSDPGGENGIVMFKSCYPNSGLGGSPTDAPTPIASNPLRGDDTTDPGTLTVGNAKGIYVDLLEYFRTQQDKLFIVITAPPLYSPTYADNARAFNNWLVNDWLSGYPYKNVSVFDFYDVLTSNGGSIDVNDAGAEGGNHHRWWSGAVQHKTDGGANTSAYATAGNDHPSAAGNQKATAEYVDLLNVAYNRWKNTPPDPPVPPSPDWRSTFYFAEGYTGAGFQEYACLENPNAAAAATWVKCLYTDGTSLTKYYSIPASSRLTIDVNTLAGAGKELSMRIVSTSSDVVAERPMYFNYQGKWSGGHDVIGARAPVTDWYFAEGTTIPGFDEYITLLNPQTTAAAITFRYMVEGQGEVVRTGTVNAGSRATFKAADHVGANKNVSLKLEADRAIVAERPMYFTYAGMGNHGWTGGHDVMGAQAPATEANFAEGTTRGGFEEWLCIQNPNSSQISVEATYYLGPGQGSPKHKTYTIPAEQRKTVSVNGEVGAEKDVSINLASADTFVAERPMYFMYHGAWDGGHDVIGATAGLQALFAEGYTGPGFEEWLCIQNANTSAANVTITYYPEGGSPIARTHSVPASTRYTVNVNSDAGAGLSISAKVASDRAVLVERPMYFDFQSKWTGGHDVVGYAP